MTRRTTSSGFTLIELSIVLVIIGLIVGGVLVGQDLIRAAEVRATISQIEKYNTAVNTFLGKYDALPGDIPDPGASNFGFAPRGQYAGEGDGNGVLEGVDTAGNAYFNRQSAGETVMFWVDLSAAHLIDGGFNSASSTTPPGSDITGTAIGLYLPPAKLGRGNYIYAYSGGLFNGAWSNSGINYYGLSAVNSIPAAPGGLASTPAIAVAQAYSIDKKIDDGKPQSGNVTAQYLNGNNYWVDGTPAYSPPPNTSATAGSATTCMDNANVAGPQSYSIEINGGAGVNCALSFEFQ